MTNDTPLTKELQTIWLEWLEASERLKRLLHEQTAAAMLRDVERLERIQPDLDALVTAVQEIDSRAVACAHTLATRLGAKPTFNALVKALPEQEAKQVHAVANRVKTAAQSLQAIIRKNQALIENELAFIAGSLHLIAKTAEDKEGAFGSGQRAAVLIDQTV